MVDDIDAEGDAPASRFAALGIPAYRKLWWGGVFIFLASQTQQVARGWLAYELTESNKALGGVVFGFGVSLLVSTPFSGVVADRFPKRRIMILAQGTMGVAALGIAVAVSTDVIEYWMLVVASVVQGSGMAMLGPSRLAMTADLVERDALTNAIFLSNASVQSTRVFGPVVAGVLIAIEDVGIGGVYYLGAALSLLSVISAAGLPAGNPRGSSGRTPFGDMADGVDYVRRRPELTRLLTIGVLVVMFGFPHVTFLPSMIQDIYELDAWALGVLTGSAAVGAVSSSLILANVAPKRLTSLQFRAGVGFALTLAVFAAMPTYWGGVVIMLAVGASSSAYQAMNNSQALVIADVEYHGRVQSLLMLAFSGFGLMALPMGLLADEAGIRETMVLMAVLVGVSVLLGEAWRRRQVQPALTDL